MKFTKTFAFYKNMFIIVLVFGAQLSLVEYLLWEQGVEGSNPFAPTTGLIKKYHSLWYFFIKLCSGGGFKRQIIFARSNLSLARCQCIGCGAFVTIRLRVCLAHLLIVAPTREFKPLVKSGFLFKFQYLRRVRQLYF